MSIYIKVLTQKKRVFSLILKFLLVNSIVQILDFLLTRKILKKKEKGEIGLNALQIRHTRNSGPLTDSKSINSKLLRGGNISFACLLLMRLHEIGFLQE